MEIKYLETQYFWKIKIDFPMISVGADPDPYHRKVLWIRIRQTDTDPDSNPWFETSFKNFTETTVNVKLIYDNFRLRTSDREEG